MSACQGVSAPQDIPLAHRAFASLGRLWVIVACLAPTVAMGQSFDCAKAQITVDKTICASPRLRQLDSEMAAAYATALKRDTAQADAVRSAQRAWGGSRSACFAHRQQPDSETCLAAAYTARLAALAPAATPPAPVAHPARLPTEAAAPAPVAHPAQPPIAATAPAPVARPALPPTTAAAPAAHPAQPSTAATAPAAIHQAAFAPPRLAANLPPIPPAAGTLERDRFPTAGETDILLHVTTPGRFAISATSATGTALQLVDMLTGPANRQGWPGKQDGRIDALLDTGTYKVRAFGAEGATGDTTLSLTGFAETGAAQIAPGYQPLAGTLSDLHSQSFWLVVPDGSAPVRIEAAGRSLGALALWRDGRDLVDLPAITGSIAATPAHPLTDIVLSGPLPPGTYRLTAYGGPRLAWADGATDEPLYLRTGRSTDLLAGGLSGAVGVFGTEVFDVAPDAAQALLVLPQPADTELRADAAGAEAQIVSTARNDRARVALLGLPARSARNRSVTLQASPGQAFTLRPLADGQPVVQTGFTMVEIDRPGRYRLAIQAPAASGDEAPAAAILARFRLDSSGTRDTDPQVIASQGVPAIGPAAAWRTRFNLRGETALLFHVTADVTVAVLADGPQLTARIATPTGAVMNAQGGGAVATNWALSPGWYTLVLTPKPGAAGLLDLTLGPPGLIPPGPERPEPEAPVLGFDAQTVDSQSRLAVLANHVPNEDARLLVRPVPIELASGPLVETVPAGKLASFEVHASDAGILTVRNIAGDTPMQSRGIEAGAGAILTLPPADRTRTLAVSVLPVPLAARPEPARAPALTPLQAGATAFLTLGRDSQASFALNVGQGGLYQVQTLGRLKTSGRIGTAFIPTLGRAVANGVGSNMLLQRYLRAGRYRLDVGAHDSAGRLGVTAAQTPLSEGAPLLPGGTTRATLPVGTGVAFPIRIDAAGRYYLDLLGDGRQFQARLEDADGWPLRAVGAFSSIDQDFQPGRYRLIVQPGSVEARTVARLRKLELPVALAGHGPHPLPFEAPQSLEWREPAGRDDPRTPDLWTFALAGPAKVTLTLTGEGMAASLLADQAAPLARVIAGTKLSLDLAAGHYRVAASSLGRNDRLGYTILLHSEALQPNVPRRTAVPADLTFAVADPRVVALTSFGSEPLRAELRDASGAVLAREAGRTNDWNIALSRRLAAGEYHLVLTPLVPPGGAHSAADGGDSNDAAQASDQGGNQGGDQSGSQGSDQGSGSGGMADAASDQAQPPDQGTQSADQGDADKDQVASDQSASDQASSGQASSGQASSGQASTDQAASDQASSDQSASDKVGSNQADSDKAGGDQASSDRASSDQASSDQADSDQSGTQPARSAAAQTEITLSLPQDQPEVTLPASLAINLTAGGVQHVTLPDPPASSLLVVAAEAPVEIILALEQRGADGQWRQVGQSQGLAPVIGVPTADASPAGNSPAGNGPTGNSPAGNSPTENGPTGNSPAGNSPTENSPAGNSPTENGPTGNSPAWRISAWTVDGGTAPIRFASWAVTAAATPIGRPATRTIATGTAATGTVPLAPVVLDGITQHWNAASVADPDRLALRADGSNPALMATSVAGVPAETPPNGMIAAQSDRVWLLSPDPTAPHLAVAGIGPDAALPLAVPAGGKASLPAGSGRCAFVARSGLGQPGLQAGQGMGTTQGSAFALCGGPIVSAWNAGDATPLRLRLQRVALTQQPEVAVDQAAALLLPPHAAVPLRLPDGAKRIDVSLASGSALVAGSEASDGVTAWAGDAALSRSLTGAWTTATLVNTRDAPAPAALTMTSVPPPSPLATGEVFRRFFGAGGSFTLNVTAEPGQRLVLAGAASATAQRSDGQVRQGRVVPLDGPALAVVTHAQGPLALWIEGPNLSPWLDTPPQDVNLPQRLTLQGNAQSFRLSPTAPILLRLSSSAPVIIALGSDPPVLFGNGLTLARYVPAGETALRVLSPQDGPLSGTLELSGTPVIPVVEGFGAPVAIPPGGAAVFGFSVTAAGPVGLGVTADPDRVAVRLLDEHGQTLQRGVSMLRSLTPGRYLLEASVPPDAPTTLARPTVLGIVPHPSPPPPEVIRSLLLAAGFAPPAGTPQVGTPQAGTPQAGTPQAGTPQAGTPQAGTPRTSPR
jgi:uncharacterized protein